MVVDSPEPVANPGMITATAPWRVLLDKRHGELAVRARSTGQPLHAMHACACMQVEEQDCLVCVLLDEVESLTRARSAAVAGSEPADAIRAVNALLTQVWWAAVTSAPGGLWLALACHQSSSCASSYEVPGGRAAWGHAPPGDGR